MTTGGNRSMGYIPTEISGNGTPFLEVECEDTGISDINLLRELERAFHSECRKNPKASGKMYGLEFEYDLHPEGGSSPVTVTVTLTSQQLDLLAELVAQYITEELYEKEELEKVLSNGVVHKFGLYGGMADILNMFDEQEDVIFRTIAESCPAIASRFKGLADLIEDEIIDLSLLSELPDAIWPQVNRLLRDSIHVV